MEAIVLVGIIVLVGSLILRLLAVLDEMHSNKTIITKNLKQLHELNYKLDFNLKSKQEYLYELNQSISKKLQISPPPIYIQDTDVDNAIAVNTGFFKAVIFEYKTFEGLDKQGLGAVLAHELYHIQQKHYLKSIIRHLFICVSWLVSTVFLLIHFMDKLNIPDPMTKGDNFYWIICLIFFYAGSNLIGDHFNTALDRFISRRQEIECDFFSADATSFSDYLMEANYFKDRESSFWNEKLSGFSSIKAQVFNTHPNWNKRILAVASSPKDK